MDYVPITTINALASGLLIGRIESLKKDVHHCVMGDYPAPIPAILYCFSTIDLLGALYCGDARPEAPVTFNARKYMTDVMKYGLLEATLIQKVFRHKLVHLAQPTPLTRYEEKEYLWRWVHNNRRAHLTILDHEAKNRFWFEISIWSLAEDIETSVVGTGGYLSRLNCESELQGKFLDAYEHIFGSIRV